MRLVPLSEHTAEETECAASLQDATLIIFEEPPRYAFDGAEPHRWYLIIDSEAEIRDYLTDNFDEVVVLAHRGVTT